MVDAAYNATFFPKAGRTAAQAQLERDDIIRNRGFDPVAFKNGTLTAEQKAAYRAIVEKEYTDSLFPSTTQKGLGRGFVTRKEILTPSRGRKKTVLSSHKLRSSSPKKMSPVKKLNRTLLSSKKRLSAKTVKETVMPKRKSSVKKK